MGATAPESAVDAVVCATESAGASTAALESTGAEAVVSAALERSRAMAAAGNASKQATRMEKGMGAIPDGRRPALRVKEDMDLGAVGSEDEQA